ncbi:MAG TPA: hypothetical protein VMF64_14615, partial [Steroidobacteraceae bacterium]|nr:hypothetical protein [Steroidobacteraceae bacterium]
PDAGRAWVLGEPALALTDTARQRLGYVPQSPDTLGWMRVGDMLAFVDLDLWRTDRGHWRGILSVQI